MSHLSFKVFHNLFYELPSFGRLFVLQSPLGRHCALEGLSSALPLIRWQPPVCYSTPVFKAARVPRKKGASEVITLPASTS